MEVDLRPLDMFGRARVTRGDRFQPLPAFIVEKDADCLGSLQTRTPRPDCESYVGVSALGALPIERKRLEAPINKDFRVALLKCRQFMIAPWRKPRKSRMAFDLRVEPLRKNHLGLYCENIQPRVEYTT